MISAIALIDANNFYVSCERLFRPDLRDRPVVVLSNNDGCIVSRSQEAKDLGIHMAEPAFKVRDLLTAHNVTVFSSNYALYGDLSQRMFGILKAYSPNLEYYSIDEAFVNLQAESAAELQAIGRTIRAQIQQQLGIPVSVGIATTKTLAKVAAFHAKKSDKANGVLNLAASPFLDLALQRTPIDEIWGLGRKLSAKLLGRGYENALKLRDGQDEDLKRVLNVIGMGTVFELRGVPCFAIDHHTQARKTVIVSRSFGAPVYELSELAAAISFHITRAGEKLRRSGQVAGALSVYIRTNRFSEDRFTGELTVPLVPKTDTTPELLHAALAALEQVYESGRRYVKAGVMLTDLSSAAALPFRLWDNEAHERERRLVQAIDAVNERFGYDTVSYGLREKNTAWEMRQDLRSARYTTKWDELLTVGKQAASAC